MAIKKDDFDKIWASTSPLTPYRFSESQYKEGWNFVGNTPPSRQMWDFLQKQNDEKSKFLLDKCSTAAPTGVVQAFAGRTTPQGWLLCDGSAVSRTDYAALYAVIGTTYGAGNGSTTFNLPNLVDKFVEGSATAGTVKSAGLPNIEGSFQTRYPPWDSTASAASGAFASPPTTGPTDAQAGSGESINHNIVSFSASKSNSIYGKSSTVQPPALTMRYIIKY